MGIFKFESCKICKILIGNVFFTGPACKEYYISCMYWPVLSRKKPVQGSFTFSSSNKQDISKIDFDTFSAFECMTITSCQLFEKIT